MMDHYLDLIVDVEVVDKREAGGTSSLTEKMGCKRILERMIGVLNAQELVTDASSKLQKFQLPHMNDPLINVWIIADTDGTIPSAHCFGCRAGLTESSSHVASAMFYIECWTCVNRKMACMQVKCGGSYQLM
ncbi:hypothetical protein ACROYT_G014396 [Oculina patagonica]